MSLGNDVAHRILQREPALANTLFPQIGTIVSAACLAHDLGNPPFGHSGEKAIQTFFTEGAGRYLQQEVSDSFWQDVTHFEGNANAFRLLAHRFKGRREGGFVMTYATLASIVKYPHSSSYAGEHGKFGFFCEEKNIYRQIAVELGIPCIEEKGGQLKYARHPLVYLVEAADDICYEIMDIEDAHKLKILSYEETKGLLLGFFDEEIRQHIEQRIIDEDIMLLICLAYSICDIVCILFFCPFETFWLKNKCCGSCRIYNWDYAMMFTPLFFVRKIYTWTLLIAAVLLLIRWEIAVYRYPERFSEKTNAYLHCENCTEKLCTHKKQLQTLWVKIREQEKRAESRIRSWKR